MAGGGTGGGKTAGAARAPAGVLCLVLCGTLAAALAGCSSFSAGPPLVILEVCPPDEGMLPEGSPLAIQFNLPFEEQSLARQLSVYPPRQLRLVRAGALAEVYIEEAVPGQVFSVSIAAGVLGTGGERLQSGLTTRVVIAPPGWTGDLEDDPAGRDEVPRADGVEVTGARFWFEGHGVFACDLRGSYRVPHFDRVRLYLSRKLRPGERFSAALLEVDLRGQQRLVPAATVAGEDWIDLELRQGTLSGLSYELRWFPATAPASSDPAADGPLFTLTVRGTPQVYVWSLRPSTGEVTGIGTLDLGFEVSRLAGNVGGPLYALGSPGGAAWQGLAVVQQLDRALLPVGPAAAVYSDSAELHAGPRGGGDAVMLVSGPAAGIAPLVGEQEWDGYLPSPPATPGPSGAAPDRRSAGVPDASAEADLWDEPALIALTPSGPVTLVTGSDVGAKFISPGSLAPDGRTAAFVTHAFSQTGTLVKLWAVSLPRNWRTAGPLEGPLFPREIAQALYPEEPGGHFSYGGSAVWSRDGDCVWWDVLLCGGQIAEVWRVDPATGSRELFARDGAMPLESPDGTMLFFRTASGGTVVTADGGPVRTIRQEFLWACWTPDSKGLLLLSAEGIAAVPLQGAVRQVVGFSAGPGAFVGPDEFWFVSDRRH